MNIRHALRLVLGGTILSIAIGSCLAARAQAPDSEKINDLFATIKQHVLKAEYDAELLDSYTRSSASWESHARRVSEMRTHINDLGRDFEEAKSLRPEGSEWQQDAIDEMEPLLKGMADHLSASIRHLNENQSRTKMPSWTEYVKGNREYANKAASLIRDYVDYGRAKATTEALEKKLDVPVAPGQE